MPLFSYLIAEPIAEVDQEAVLMVIVVDPGKLRQRYIFSNEHSNVVVKGICKQNTGKYGFEATCIFSQCRIK